MPRVRRLVAVGIRFQGIELTSSTWLVSIDQSIPSVVVGPNCEDRKIQIGGVFQPPTLVAPCSQSLSKESYPNPSTSPFILNFSACSGQISVFLDLFTSDASPERPIPFHPPSTFPSIDVCRSFELDDCYPQPSRVCSRARLWTWDSWYLVAVSLYDFPLHIHCSTR